MQAAGGAAPWEKDPIDDARVDEQEEKVGMHQDDEESTTLFSVCDAAFEGWCRGCRYVVAGVFTPLRLLSGAAASEEEVSPKKE